MSLFRRSYFRSFSTTVLTAVTISLTLRNLYRVGLLIGPVLLCLKVSQVFLHGFCLYIIFYRIFYRNISYCDDRIGGASHTRDREAPADSDPFKLYRWNLIALQQFVVKKIKGSE